MWLPTEVLEAIIDQASDNPTTLRQLSLTCATLLPRSRLRLFSGIVIRTVEQLEASHDFLDSNPWLVSLVRKVTLFTIISEDNPKPNIRLLDIVPIHLLNRLPNLLAWTMTSQSRWTIPTVSLHRSVFWRYQKHSNRIRRLELSDIHFDRLSDFKRLVSAFTRIDILACNGISFKWRKDEDAGSSPVAVNVNTPPLPISTLTVSSSEIS
ncbi:hypothetical protein GSI_04543 [Ganoderma sinense ZZ0214-1]|uniref:F-box domain-containing protein n=1 Tax=Ganoderma sinense ZZ0214-1 TaxID=1077348 RepID=A0A2G8SH40_9APHY|nr:hypothetical protein GSI_04543 [Ganoderma sinense ZZ0214-1]